MHQLHQHTCIRENFSISFKIFLSSLFDCCISLRVSQTKRIFYSRHICSMQSSTLCLVQSCSREYKTQSSSLSYAFLSALHVVHEFSYSLASVLCISFDHWGGGLEFRSIRRRHKYPRFMSRRRDAAVKWLSLTKCNLPLRNLICIGMEIPELPSRICLSKLLLEGFPRHFFPRAHLKCANVS